MEPDFAGYATKAGIKCTDGRTITAEAFKHMDGMTVPLVWQHVHDNPGNILGHAVLEAKNDGVYAYGFFNESSAGKTSKELVQHKDIKNLSIFANSLVEKQKTVLHGQIREVSLVLSGANKGALIDYIRLQHGDDPTDFEVQDDPNDGAAIIHTGLEIEVPEQEPDEDDVEDDDEEVSHADSDETIQDIYDSLDEDQKNVVHYLIGAALESASAEHADTEEGIAHQEGNEDMPRNVFETASAETESKEELHVLSHDAIKGIVSDAVRSGSLKSAVENYALAHGITNIDVMFPDAKLISNRPELNARRTEWVSDVLAKTRKSPFARIKTLMADLTQDEARAKGYIKGNYKVEEWFGMTRRTTSPTTIYKKQKLDRDDIIDITDFDVVAFLKEEMRLMLDEEVARAILVGDGRQVSDTDKIKDPAGLAEGTGIRSILNENELYATTLYVNVDDANSSYEEIVDAVMDGMEQYKGSGTPTFYTTIKHLNMFKKARDGQQRRYYENNGQIAEALGVDRVVPVEVMNDYSDLVGIIVNLSDYNVGTDRGGEVNYFDFFDIDYNQEKYLMETRMSGALAKIKSAIIVRKVASTSVAATPTVPTFNKTTGVVTIPTVTGVVYKDGAGTTLSPGAQTALAAGASSTVVATPASGYFFKDTVVDGPWTFKRPSA